LYSTELSYLRSRSGEDEYLRRITGKQYGVVKYTGKDFRKLERVPHSGVKEGTPYYDITPT
jgi:hypothetical protein